MISSPSTFSCISSAFTIIFFVWNGFFIVNICLSVDTSKTESERNFFISSSELNARFSCSSEISNSSFSEVSILSLFTSLVFKSIVICLK